MEVFRVWRITERAIDIEGQGKLPQLLAVRDLEDGSMVFVYRYQWLRKGVWRLFTSPLRRDRNYEIIVHNRRFFVDFSEHYWAQFRFDGWLGAQRQGDKTVFRLFAPRAQRIILSLFEHPYHETEPAPWYEAEMQLEMTWKGRGLWEGVVDRDCAGYYYGYRVFGPKGPGELFNPQVVIADPYARAVASFLACPQRHLGMIVDDAYVWKTDKKHPLPQAHEWIIYECHLRDMTMLSEGCVRSGTYEGFVEENQVGGIAHLRDLGVNAVEFLPLQEFCEIEPPFGLHSAKHIYNNFNAYSRNHWGYMTTSFFTAESYYLTGTIQPNTWNGVGGHQTRAMKAMVDKLHGAGIAVIMDVVYNHVSMYDYNALRLIDRRYYFWTTADGHDDQKTYCGNDFRSERFMARRLIVDSLEYWVREYRVDGFRFDLGTVIDWETYRMIVKTLRALKPNIFLTAEPWHGGRGGERDGGEYCLLPGRNGFSRLGISAWNDRFRNMVRGDARASEHPQYGLVFGKTSADQVWEALLCYPGIFERPWHSVNYIESHDNHCFSDFLRLGNGDVTLNKEIKHDETLVAAQLTPLQLDQAKLAAFVLFMAPGVVMIHEGQELGRMRVVHPPDGSFSLVSHVHWHKLSGGEWSNHHHHWPQNKPRPWTIDDDGYEKDNLSNWVDWRLKVVNEPLYDFYRAVIAFRRRFSWMGAMRPPKMYRITPLDGDALGWGYRHDREELSVLVNFSSQEAVFALPPWPYETAFVTHLHEDIFSSEGIVLAPLRGVVLRRKHGKG